MKYGSLARVAGFSIWQAEGLDLELGIRLTLTRERERGGERGEGERGAERGREGEGGNGEREWREGSTGNSVVPEDMCEHKHVC